MGDRGVITVKQWKEGKVHLYTHWDASNLEAVLSSALAKRWRWDDPPYLTRIIFEEMIKDAIDQETGYGIYSYVPGDAWRVLVVDSVNEVVELIDHGESQYKKSFEDFIV